MLISEASIQNQSPNLDLIAVDQTIVKSVPKLHVKRASSIMLPMVPTARDGIGGPGSKSKNVIPFERQLSRPDPTQGCMDVHESRFENYQPFPRVLSRAVKRYL